MEFETDRLYLVPLSSDQLRLLAYDIKALEKELNINYRAEPVEGHFSDIIKKQIAVTENDEKNFLFHSFWLIVRKSDRTVVGSSDFKNIPDEKGEVEIGYGLGKEFEHNGYMTETVKAMCRWALNQSDVKHVIAETETYNLPSQNVLKRCGFKLFKQGETFWWKL